MLDLPPIHNCKYRQLLETASTHKSQAVFSGWSKLEAALPVDVFKWLSRLTEIGPLGEVGAGELRRIRQFGAACWRVGFADAKESEALKRRVTTIRTQKKGLKKRKA